MVIIYKSSGGNAWYHKKKSVDEVPGGRKESGCWRPMQG
jgi:hypothetical protein